MPSVPFDGTPQRDLVQKPNGLGKLKPRSPISFLLIAIFLIALLLRVGVAIHFPSIEWGDQIFNSLEPAHHMAYGYGIVVWEWELESLLGVSCIPGRCNASNRLGGTRSAGHSTRHRHLVVAALADNGLVRLRVGETCRGNRCRHDRSRGLCHMGPTGVFCAESTERRRGGEPPLTGSLPWDVRRTAAGEETALLSMLFCGLAVSLRMYLAPAVLFAVLYFCHANWERRTLHVSRASTAGCFFGLVDAATWSYPFQSFLGFFWVAVIKGQSFANRGIGYNWVADPWYWYFLVLAVYFLPLFALALLGVRRSPFLAWLAFIIVASLSVFPHKEYRYMYPVMPIVITLAGLGFVEFAEDFNKWAKTPLSPRAIMVAGLAFCMLTLMC